MKIAILMGESLGDVDPRILVGLKGCFGDFKYQTFATLNDAFDIEPDRFDLLLLAPPFIDQTTSREMTITRVQNFVNSLCCTGFPVIAVHYGLRDEDGNLDALGTIQANRAGRLIAFATSNIPLTCNELLACGTGMGDGEHIKGMVKEWQRRRYDPQQPQQRAEMLAMAGAAPTLPKFLVPSGNVVSFEAFRRLRPR